MTRHRISILIAAAGLFAAPLRAAVNVQHQAVGCLLADAHPRLEARFEPEAEVARARVFFRAAGTPHWYSVEMTHQAGLWSGVLPKPKRSAARIEYYLEATDKAFVPARTGEHAAEVVAGPGACRKDVPLAAAVPSARVVVTAAAGAPALPAGFLEAGLVAAGGGLSAGVLAGIIGGGALAGGAVVVATRDDEPEEPPSIAGSWVGTGSDGMSRAIMRPLGLPSCRYEDELFLELQRSGAAVTGTARLVTRAGTTCGEGVVGGSRTYQAAGTQEGASVSLTLSLDTPPLGVSMQFLVGTVQGPRMSGTVTTVNPGAAGPGSVTGQGTWSVRRP
jgi:hypothetical protein